MSNCMTSNRNNIFKQRKVQDLMKYIKFWFREEVLNHNFISNSLGELKRNWTFPKLPFNWSEVTLAGCLVGFILATKVQLACRVDTKFLIKPCSKQIKSYIYFNSLNSYRGNKCIIFQRSLKKKIYPNPQWLFFCNLTCGLIEYVEGEKKSLRVT